MNSTRPLDTTVGLMIGGPATALLDDDHDVLGSAMCPMCHTSASMPQSAIEAGGDWRCVRCGQHWDAGRLVAVAAYAEWAGHRDRVGRRGMDGDHAAAVCGDSRERLGGRP